MTAIDIELLALVLAQALDGMGYGYNEADGRELAEAVVKAINPGPDSWRDVP